MINLWGTTKDYFWEQHELLLYLQIHCVSGQVNFSLDDLMVPFQYPKSFDYHISDQFTTLYHLSCLEQEGVKIKSVTIDPTCQIHLHQLRVKPPAYLTTIINKFFKSREETNQIILSWKEFFPYTLLFCAKSLALSQYITITLEVSYKTLKKGLCRYAEKVKQNKLTLEEGRAFSYKFTKELMKSFFNELHDIQGNHISIEFKNKTKHNDQLLTFFANHFNKQYGQWKKGAMQLRFFDALLAYSLIEKKCEFIGFEKQNDASVVLHLNLPDQKNTKDKSIEEHISSIEIESNDRYEFYVYVNHNSIHPITLNKKTKAGALIYKLAGEGSVKYHKNLKRTLSFISSSSFKLFSKTKYKPEPIVEVTDDGYIIPADYIKITMV